MLFMLLLSPRAQLKYTGYVRFSKLWIAGSMAHCLFEKYTTRKSLWVIFLLVTLYSWDLSTNTLEFCNCYGSYWWFLFSFDFDFYDNFFLHGLISFSNINFFSWSNKFLEYQLLFSAENCLKINLKCVNVFWMLHHCSVNL